MKENFLHFLSEVPSKISINGENIGFIDNHISMELDVITKTNYLYLTYEPISTETQAIPYTVNLNTNNTPNTNNEYIKIVPFPDNNYDIIMKPFYYYQISESNVLYNGSIGKFFVSIVSGTITRIIIYSGVTIVFSIDVVPLKTVQVKECNNIITIEGIIDDSTYYFLAIDTTNFSILHNDISHSIETSNDSIALLKFQNSLCKHAKVSNLNLKNKTKEEYYVFENNTPNTNISSTLIPQAFLECIKFGDEKTAKYFLSNSYQSANIKQFNNYFGNIEEIYLNRHALTENKLNYTIKTSKWRNFTFLIDNNKIYEIEEIF